MIVAHAKYVDKKAQVLIAGVAKLVFGYCYSVNFGPSWLLNVDFPLQLVVCSIPTLLKQITGLKIFFKI